MALIGTLTSGVSAVRTFSKGLEVIGSNIANVNTTAYKSSSTSFADTFSNTLRAATPTDSAVQIGTGVQVGGITTNYTQGALSSTGKGTDLGISGQGYFVVKDTAGNLFATRDGNFHFDTSGNLVNSLGYNVLASDGTTNVTVPSYTQTLSVSIAGDGTINATYPASYAGATPTTKVGVMLVPDESKLMRQGNNLYDFASTGATAATTMGVAGTGRGKIQSGTLELSNVDLTDQFSELITTQRSFQAGSRLITVSDSVLEDIVNLKRS